MTLEIILRGRVERLEHRCSYIGAIYWTLRPGSAWITVTGGGDPLSDQRILLGRLHAHGEVEKGLRRRKPVRLLVRPGVLVLDVEVERTIRSRPIGPTLLSK